MFILLLSMISAYLFYKFGLRNLFKSKLFAKKHADFYAYAFFMMAGTALGEVIGYELASWLRLGSSGHILTGTVVSISLGELFFHYNNSVVNRFIMRNH